jgi:glucose-6-phosphate-specific signal transduction histidine kinase
MSNSSSAPRSGLAALFSVAGRPAELKVSFWIWFAGGILGVMGGLLGMLASLVLFAAAPAAAAAVVTLMLLAAAVGAAQVVFAVKMKAGRTWARLALTVLTAITLVLAVMNTVTGVGQGGNWAAFLISAVATVLMWLPNSRAWFSAGSGRNTSAE